MSNMEESILTTILSMLGYKEQQLPDSYSKDIIIHINSVFMILNQLGVGPADTFSISGFDEKWSDFLADGKDLQSVKSYIYLKVKMIFDPPTSSVTLDSMKSLITEFECRLNYRVDPAE